MPTHDAQDAPHAPFRGAFNARPGEQYTLRRQVLRLFGAAFHVYDPQGALVAYCRQKALRLREDLRLYTDESCSTELLVIRARSIIDFSAAYDVFLPTGERLGTFRRRGLTSTFLKDSWEVLTPDGRPLASLEEQGGAMAFLRRLNGLIAVLSPQTFTLARTDAPEQPIATFRTHFNVLVYRLGISILADDPELDDLMILAAASLIGAIEGRQDGG